MKEFLHHLFVPRVSNNHRAKLLHHSYLVIIISFLLVCNVVIAGVKTNFPQVLGTTISMSVKELLQFTNKERVKDGLPTLQLNDELSQAAKLKAQDMFAKNYWAHNATDGTTPWYFIEKAGYTYVYAGENLAKGFTTSQDTVAAWMESPTHRENMLSENYSDIGFAIEKGTLQGEETVLVVEMFGSKTKPVIARKRVNNLQLPENNTEIVPNNVFGVSMASLPLINSFSLSKNLAQLVLFSFLLALLMDMVIIKRKNLARIVGHNADHIFFLSVIMLLVVLFRLGTII